MVHSRLLLCALLTVGFSAIAKESPKRPAIVKNIRQILAAEATSSRLPAGATISEITLHKAAIMGRTFNYSASLQFSTVVDQGTADMAMALGEIPANFQILDQKLRLVSDGSINFESDVNHPARLIYEFPILKEDSDTLTIRAEHASPVVDSFLFGSKERSPVNYSFIRSLEFVEADELFLIESTVELQDGSLAEFMESLRPREQTVPADVKVIYNDPDLNPQAARYRFLDAGPVYFNKSPTERIKTKAAVRHLVKNGEPMRWYVTANIPEKFLGDIKNSVEAWNRYSRAAGTPNLVSFEGRLPFGIKVGDPRFNLIVWDTVQEAGAAYESQNADPATGVQSHSMIYLPYAWVKIGTDYWKKISPNAMSPGELQVDAFRKSLAKRTFAGRALPVHCVDAPELHVSLSSLQNPEEFGRSLLKQTLFHEVGHALGMDHEFKGSLSYDSEDAAQAFSTSIMDYNHYDEEQSAFTSLDSADGPLLEYDRQLFSVLYNDGKDVKATDPEVAACNDLEADAVEEGVDPLCNRYDIGKDPTLETLRSLELVTKADSAHGRMQAISGQKLIDALRGLPLAAEVKTESETNAAMKKGFAGVFGTMGIYLSATANSFGYMGSQSMRSLKVFQSDILPEGYVESEMRERALTALSAAATMNALPSLSQESLAQAKASLKDYINSTAYMNGLGSEDKQKQIDAFAKAVDEGFATNEALILSKMRMRFIEAIASTPTAPLAILQRSGEKVDLEIVVMNTLSDLASAKAGAFDRPVDERAAALASLKSYSRSENYTPYSERLVGDLKLEIRNSSDPMQRESLRTLLRDFTKAE